MEKLHRDLHRETGFENGHRERGFETSMNLKRQSHYRQRGFDCLESVGVLSNAVCNIVDFGSRQIRCTASCAICGRQAHEPFSEDQVLRSSLLFVRFCDRCVPLSVWHVLAMLGRTVGWECNAVSSDLIFNFSIAGLIVRSIIL